MGGSWGFAGPRLEQLTGRGLMMRALILFLIGIAFGTAGGFLVAGGLGEPSHDHAGHTDVSHDHSTLTIWEGAAPDLQLALFPDTGTAQNLQIVTNGFTFTPEDVNGPPVAGSGHAHVYINGEKIARAYSAYMHLANVPEGATVRVTLNANNHTVWGIDGQPIAAEVTVP